MYVGVTNVPLTSDINLMMMVDETRDWVPCEKYRTNVMVLLMTLKLAWMVDECL